MKYCGQVNAPMYLVIQGEETSGTHRIEGWVNSWFNLDLLEKRKICFPTGNQNTNRPTYSLFTVLTAI